MLAVTNGDAVPDQSNLRVIIVDEPPEGDETSHWDWSLGNPFTSPGDMVAGPYGHGGALPPSQWWGSGDSGDKGEYFCTMVQTLEGIIPLSSVTADNDPHSEVYLMTILQYLREVIQNLMFQRIFKVCFYLNQELQASLPVGIIVPVWEITHYIVGAIPTQKAVTESVCIPPSLG